MSSVYYACRRLDGYWYILCVRSKPRRCMNVAPQLVADEDTTESLHCRSVAGTVSYANASPYFRTPDQQSRNATQPPLLHIENFLLLPYIALSGKILLYMSRVNGGEAREGEKVRERWRHWT